jgi:hypothetical protein
MFMKYSQVLFCKKSGEQWQIIRIEVFYLFLNVALAVDRVGVRKKSIDTIM